MALVVLLASTLANAKTSYDNFPAVKKGGTFTDAISMTPTMLNPILITNMEDREVSSWLFMSLLGTDPQTYEDMPGLAEKVETSKDKKEYTFTLNAKAKWSDGTPVTSDDMVFTFEKIMDPKIDAATVRGFLTGVTIEKINNSKFKFKVEQPKFDTKDFLDRFIRFKKSSLKKKILIKQKRIFVRSGTALIN